VVDYKPILDNVLVELFPPKDKVGEILLAEVTKSVQNLQYAKVVAVGPGKRAMKGGHVQMTVKAGDVVVIGEVQNCAPVRSKIKDQTLLMFKEDSIAGIVDDFDPQKDV